MGTAVLRPIKAISPNTPWWLVGALGVLTGVFILSYYGVIAGWAFGYIFKGAFAAETTFGGFISDPVIVVPLFALFLMFTTLVVLGGVAALHHAPHPHGDGLGRIQPRGP